jgi:hypothetical protein
MKKIQLISIALITIMALTVVSGAGMLKAGADSSHPTSEELAQALDCSEITARQGWVWSYSVKGVSFVHIQLYEAHDEVKLYTELRDPNLHEEASVSVSHVKGPLRIYWDTYYMAGSGLGTVSVLDSTEAVVASQAAWGISWPSQMTTDDYINYAPYMDVPGDGALYTVQWKLTATTLNYFSMWEISTVRVRNLPPVAHAGADQSIRSNANALLDGSASVDDEPGAPLTYAWSVKESPAGSSPRLSDPTAVKPVFTAEQLGLYVIQLVVTDVTGKSSASADTVSVWVNNAPVITMATFQQNGVGAPVFLLGSATDLENDPLTYQWSLTGKPPESALQLGLLSVSSVGGFVPDALGTYTARLTVSDGKPTATTQDVSILVAPTGAPIASKVLALKSAVKALPNSAVSPIKKAALLAGLNAVQKQVDKGKYGTAAKLLEYTVLARMDGCVKRGAPDHDDFIKQCDTQLQLYSQVQPLALYLAWLAEHPP